MKNPEEGKDQIEKKFRKQAEMWEKEKVKKVISVHPERKEEFSTDSGIPVERLYGPEQIDYEKSLGFPGDYPFTRGVQPTMYRGRFWTMRQYAGFGTAEESNRRYRYLLEKGTTGLSVAFDLPTQMGYDSDHPIAEGEVGKVGVAIDSLRDMEILFDGISLDKVSTSMTINSTASILLAFYITVAKNKGIPAGKLKGTIQNDILKEYIARGTYIYPPEPSLRLITDIFRYCSDNVPDWNTISISGYHIREAGSNAVQEVAFTLANGIAYVEAAINAGLDVNLFGGRLSFFFNAHNNFFEEIAKFRAARRIWAGIMRERFKASSPKAQMLRFHTQTAGSTLTAQQPQNNIIRVAFQAMAAVLGGTQSLHTNSFDEALGLPTEESVATALRTQQIIAHESGAAETIDPVAGGYYVEKLTDEIEQRVMEYLDKIDSIGGAVKAVESGFFQNEIAKSAYEYQKNIEKEENIVVGVNKFTADESGRMDMLEINKQAINNQIKQLKEVRGNRDNSKVENLLKNLQNAAGSPDNLMPYILACVEEYATLGEISDTLRKVFGKYIPV